MRARWKRKRKNDNVVARAVFCLGKNFPKQIQDAQRILIVSKCAGAVRAKARERQATSTGGNTPQLMENFPQAEKSASRDELGAMAGVSGKTFEHGEVVVILPQGKPTKR